MGLTRTPGWRGRSIPFDPAVWKASPAIMDVSSVRMRMARDLLRSGRLIGQTRQGVVDLLGEPDTGRPRSDYAMISFLGKRPVFVIASDQEHLIVNLDQHGRVIGALFSSD